jgi:hypothetical protein
LELLDWVGRTVHSDKRGAIPAGLVPILIRLGLKAKGLLQRLGKFGTPHPGAESAAATEPKLILHLPPSLAVTSCFYRGRNRFRG